MTVRSLSNSRNRPKVSGAAGRGWGIRNKGGSYGVKQRDRQSLDHELVQKRVN